jgi:hypothetical protein
MWNDFTSSTADTSFLFLDHLLLSLHVLLLLYWSILKQVDIRNVAKALAKNLYYFLFSCVEIIVGSQPASHYYLPYVLTTTVPINDNSGNTFSSSPLIRLSLHQIIIIIIIIMLHQTLYCPVL